MSVPRPRKPHRVLADLERLMRDVVVTHLTDRRDIYLWAAARGAEPNELLLGFREELHEAGPALTPHAVRRLARGLGTPLDW